MDPVLILCLMSVGIFAGVLGTLFGIGGGTIFIPALTILFDLTASEAVAVSLVGIIAASTGAASYYVRNDLSNVRLGLLLEITTAVGAMIGAFLASYVANWVLLAIFGLLLVYSAISMVVRREKIIEHSEDGSLMNFSYTDNNSHEVKKYKVGNVKGGMVACAGIGTMSSMTGIGGGSITVPLMNMFMHVPIKVASATSNYMIGITAFSGAIIYFIQGNLLLDYAAALAIGAFVGSLIGTRISGHLNAGPMRRYFSILLLALSVIIFLEAGGIL